MISKFADDEANSATKTVLLMKIGGGNNGIGIHGTHLGPGVHIRYRHSDEARQTIPWVKYNDDGRQDRVYAAPDAKPDGAGLQSARWIAWTATTARRIPMTCRSAPWTRPWTPA